MFDVRILYIASLDFINLIGFLVMRRKAATFKAIPKWLLLLPKKSLISPTDFANAIGISRHAFNLRRSRGCKSIPEPDCFLHKGDDFTFQVNSNRPRWKVVTVRNYMRKVLREEMKKSNAEGNVK